MNAPSPWLQYQRILAINLQASWSEKSRFLGCLFFSLTLQLLIMMGFASVPLQEDVSGNYFAVQLFLTLFIGVEIVLLKSFDAEKAGGVFTLMQSYPVDPYAWYAAKVSHIWLEVILIFLPTLGLGLLVQPVAGFLAFGLMLLLGALITLGLVGIGVLLSGLVLGAGGREVLLPVLYFPLALPLLLAGIEGSQGMLVWESNLGGSGHWLGLSLGVAVIYMTLGGLLFGELVHRESGDDE